MLVGREQERQRLDELLLGLRRGRGGVLALIGEAGIGKTTLLRYAAERATGATVLTARGIESESELPFSGLFDLVRPLLDRIDRLPDAQGRALAAALAVGEPVAAERFAVAVATLSLLAAGADDAPIVAVVDDAQWLDASSLEAILFAARRLDAEAVLLLLAARSDLSGLAGIEQLELTGLDERAARVLVARGGVPVATPVAEALVRASRGNPLALVELPASLTEAQLNGREPLEDPLPLGPALERAFARRVHDLTEQDRAALLVAAASDSDDLSTIAEALERLGLPFASLERAETAELVRLADAKLKFRHPLVRAAAYHRAEPTEQRNAHRALAHALAGADEDRRAWHLAAAATAPDEGVAGLLAQAGLNARVRGAYAAAAAALQRAAALTPAGATRAPRLLEAARCAELAGQSPRALELLVEALPLVDEALLRADVQHLRGRIEAFQAPWAAVSTVLVPEAERIEPLDPARAARMFMDAALALPDDRTRSREFLRRARAAAKRAGETLAPGVKLVLAENLRSEWIMGRAYRAPGPRQWEALLALADDLSFADDLLEVAGKASYEGTHYARAFELTRRVADAAREASALGVLATALTALVWLEYRTSEWTAAFAHATEALRLTEDTGRHVHLAALLFMLGRLEAVRGNEAQCRDHVSRAVELAGSLELEEHSRWQAGVALGLLELGLGRPEEAVGLLEPAVCAGDGSLLAGIARGHGDLIEAYIRTGNRPRAEATLAEWERRARVAERPWALAVAARCRGLLADDDRLDEHFGQALAWHAEVPTPFERARTELSYGERLRRGRRRVEARDQLRSALATFEELGAHPWAERARAELAASGARAKPRDGSAIEELTPQELQVALVVAGGATNREAAAALFVSPKTVEAHLGSIYRKLGLRSRTELASRFARERLATAAA